MRSSPWQGAQADVKALKWEFIMEEAFWQYPGFPEDMSTYMAFQTGMITQDLKFYFFYTQK